MKKVDIHFIYLMLLWVVVTTITTIVFPSAISFVVGALAGLTYAYGHCVGKTYGDQ